MSRLEKTQGWRVGEADVGKYGAQITSPIIVKIKRYRLCSNRNQKFKYLLSATVPGNLESKITKIGNSFLLLWQEVIYHVLNREVKK